MEKWIKRKWDDLKVGDKIEWYWPNYPDYKRYGVIKRKDRSEMYTSSGWLMYRDSERIIFRDEGDNKNLGCAKCAFYITLTMPGSFTLYNTCTNAPYVYDAINGPMKKPGFCLEKNKDCECPSWVIKKSTKIPGKKTEKKPWWKFWVRK
jgi:hypothetical protein